MTIIDNAVYVNGVRHAEPESLEQTFETLAEHGGMAWIGQKGKPCGVCAA